MSSVPSDIEIAQSAKLRPIADVAAEAGLNADDIVLYGTSMAKIKLDVLSSRERKGKLVLVTGSAGLAKRIAFEAVHAHVIAGGIVEHR